MNQISIFEVAYNRLDEAHRAWHSALSGYHKIDDFRAGVNAAIQSLRNATFALQKQKDHLPGFDNWYLAWQDKMRQDEILKELHNARNVIVKEADLIIKSKANAKVSDWKGVDTLEFEFNPMVDSYSVAKGYYDNYVIHLPIPEALKHRFIFTFERTWIYEKIPNHELLEAIAYSYNFLREVLSDAETHFFGKQSKKVKEESFCKNQKNNEGLLTCMLITRRERSLVFSLEDGALYSSISYDETPTKEMLIKSNNKYGDLWKSEVVVDMVAKVLSGEENPVDQVRLFLQASIANFIKDKFLVPVTFIFSGESKSPVIISHSFTNQAEKIISIERVADEVQKRNATSVLLINEAWQAMLKNDQKDFPLESRDDKKELILAYWVSAEKGKVISFPFTRNIFGKINFQAPHVSSFLTNENHGNNILLSIIKALKEST